MLPIDIAVFITNQSSIHYESIQYSLRINPVFTTNQSSIHYENSRVVHGASKWKWASLPIRDTPKGVQKASINETES